VQWRKLISLTVLEKYLRLKKEASAFLVKFPVYAAHIWLPKAHVEAPVAGSKAYTGR
jgi:NADH:ubiquinone oxidoreductase subunit 4 (subunit M)